MKKYAALALAALLACTGCQSNQTESSSESTSGAAAAGSTSAITAEQPEPTAQAETDTSEQTQPAATTAGTVEEDLPHIDVLTYPAVWRGADSYYFFNADQTSGSTLSFENGMGVAFDYERLGDGNYVFHMGSADNETKASVTSDTVNFATVTWEDGTTENFVYVSDKSVNAFRFYTNEELQTIAMAYYKEQTGYEPQYSGVQSNDDGTASIQLYDQVDDHNSTSAWYTVDRVTLIGTDDIAQTEVDLSSAASALEAGE